jgi:hypothetical protein
VTGKTIQNLIEFQKSGDNKGNQMILGILKTYGPCSPSQIKNYLIEKANQTARSNYEHGEICKDQIEMIVKANSLVRETISRKLGKLVDAGLVVRHGLKYSLSEAAMTEIRYFDPSLGKKFGNTFLLTLLDVYNPDRKSLENRIEEIILIFGFHILYSLVESCRPIDYKSKDKYLENYTKDLIIESWFKNSIDPVTYLNCFISTFSKEFDYTDRNRFNEKYTDFYDKNSPTYFNVHVLRKRFLEPLSGSDQYHMQMLYNESEERKKDYQTTSNPLYELKQDRIDDIKRILDKLYPEFFWRAELCSNEVLESSKESSFKF